MIGLIGIIVGLILIVIVVVSMWKKIPAGEAAIITGVRQRVISNGGGLVIPLIERIDRVSLQAINIEVTTTGALSSQGVPLNTTASAIVKIANNKDSILAAMETFEGDISKIEEIAKDVLIGKIREVIGTLTVEDLYSSRDEFSKQILNIVATELLGMGLELKTLTIKDIQDSNDYINSLGAKEIARVKRDANISIEEAKKEEAISVSKAKKEGEQARILAETEIAEAKKEQSLKKLEYEKEQQTAKAESDAAYKIQENITNKRVTDTEMDAEIVRQQRLKDVETEKIQIQIVAEQKNIELAQKRAERKEKELEETIVKPAEAEKKRQALQADAEKYKEIADAEAKAEQIKLEAQAQADSIRLKGQAEAEALRLQGEAEAEAIRLKLIAEAEGLEKRADALAKLGQAGLVEMLVQVLPEVSRNIAEPMSQIDKIVIMDGGNGEGNGGPVAMAKYAASTMGVVMDSVKEMTGIDIADVVKANTYDAKVNKNINVNVSDPKDQHQSHTPDVVEAIIPVTVADKTVVEGAVVNEATLQSIVDPCFICEE